jgi:penicillin-insensitive murein endopeptidase
VKTGGLILGVVFLSGCVSKGLLTDGSSVSVGTHSRGALRAAARLPLRGEGYVVPKRWAERKRNFGTDELVTLIGRVARKVRRRHRGVLGVADLSPIGGGPTPEHGSHRSGRDVDLLYYATDLRGRPVTPTAMIHYDRTGASVPPKSASPRETRSPRAVTPTSTPTSLPVPPTKLDLRRNWAMMAALVTDPEVPVQWIFIGRRISRLLLAYGKRKRKSKQLIERLALVMRQPGDASPHTDHIHVRVFCDPGDRYQGCVDRGPPRFLKKGLKYKDEPPRGPRISRKLLERLGFGSRRFPLL